MIPYLSSEQHFSQEIYFSQKILKGYVFKIAGNPFAHLIQADFLTESQGSKPYHRLGNHRGVVIDILHAFEDVLGVHAELLNPEPMFDYGRIDDNGSWSGMLGMIYNNKADFTFDWALNYDVHLPFDSIVWGHQEYVSFAAPNSIPRSKFLTIAYPFTTPVWIALIAFFFFTPIVIYGLFSSIKDKQHIAWIVLFELYWYYFGALMGEIKPNTVKINYLMQVKQFLQNIL